MSEWVRRPLRGYHAVFQLSSPSASKGEQGTKQIDIFFINEGNFRNDEGYYITRPTLSGEFLFPDQLPCLFWIAQIYLFRQVGSVDDLRSQDSETQGNHFQDVHHKHKVA